MIRYDVLLPHDVDIEDSALRFYTRDSILKDSKTLEGESVVIDGLLFHDYRIYSFSDSRASWIALRAPRYATENRRLNAL